MNLKALHEKQIPRFAHRPQPQDAPLLRVLGSPVARAAPGSFGMINFGGGARTPTDLRLNSYR